jgi:hypothetical protein
MKSIVFIIVFLIASTTSLIILNPKPVDPFSTRLDFSNQPVTEIDFDLSLLTSFQQNITQSSKHFDLIEQTVSIKDDATNAYIDLIQKRLNDNVNNALVFDTFLLETKGFENFIDTPQFITGTLKANFTNYQDSTNRYVETSISLLNPPFNISIGEQQYMPIEDASTQLITFIDLSILTIDPISIFKGLTLNSLNTDVFKLPFGYKLIITNDNVLFTNTTSRIEVIIYNNILIDMKLTINGSSVTIPQTLIDGLDTDLIVSLDLNFHYRLIYEKQSHIPYTETELKEFERVDTFTLPDIQRFLNNPFFN